MTPQYIYINKDGDKFYHKDKEMMIYHREDGPAIEYVDGSKDWYLNGKRHREGGPAIEYANGNKYWYLNNVYYSEKDFKKQTVKEVVLTMDEIADKLGVDVSKLKIAK
jgi:hypothetical protein